MFSRTKIFSFFLLLLIVVVKGNDKGKTVLLSSGYRMPVVGLGTGSIRDERTITTALEIGYRHIDGAFSYRNEKEIATSLKKFYKNGGKREDVFITSKLPQFGNRPSDVEKFVKLSLKDLDTDYIDMYLIHNPIPLKIAENGMEPLLIDGSPVLEDSIDLVGIWKAMEKQVKAGRVRSIGVSNFNKTQLTTIYENAEIKPSNLQIETHIYLQQRPLRKFCQERNIVVTGYHPLGSQFPKMNAPAALPDAMKTSIVQQLAEKYGKTPAQILLRHGIQGGLVVTPKSSNAIRMRSNLEIFDFSLTNDEMEILNSYDKGERGRVYDFANEVPGLREHPFYPFRMQEV